MSFEDLIKDLEKLKDPNRQEGESRFFKTGKGEYGEGDIFWGISTPQLRSVVKNYFHLSFEDIGKLLSSKIHPVRSAALMILVNRYQSSFAPLNQRGSGRTRKNIVGFYLKNTKNINNWDLVDISAPKILGDYFFDKDKAILYRLAKSKNLWERRISIMSTFWFIGKNQFEDTLKIAKILLNDEHDLIHKAVGWMLREIGKRDLKAEEKFLDKYYKIIPRTMLRYAIEKFPKEKREFYLKK